KPRNYRPGEPIPEDLLRRLLAARNFNQGFATVEYTASALIDLELHRCAGPEDLDPERFEREFVERTGVPKEIGLRHRLPHFQHLFAGRRVSAGFYAYLRVEGVVGGAVSALYDDGVL